jgi:outer membrane protein assembly factor BamA
MVRRPLPGAPCGDVSPIDASDPVRTLLSLVLLLPAALGAQQPASDSAATRRIIPLPAIFYTPETKLGGGAAVTIVQRRANQAPGDRPTTGSVVALYTQRAQLNTGIGADWWSRGNVWNVVGGASFQRFPFTFYGTGSAVPDTGEQYTTRTVSLGGSAQRLVRPGLYVGAGASWDDVTMLETAEGGVLEDGALVGSRGGTVAAASGLVTWDTRDNLYYAERGTFLRLQAQGAAKALGGDFAFRRVSLDARAYRRLAAAREGRQVRALAVQGLVTTTGGTVPFDRLAQIGGQNVVRGYFEGRFRDRSAAALQAELRQPVWRRVGVAAFFGAGEVGPQLGKLRLNEVRTAGGLGLRIALDAKEKINIRIDQGIGQGGSGGTYITLGEAF